MKLFPDSSEYPESRLFALDLMRGLDMFCLGYLLHCGWAVQKMWTMPDAFLWNFEHYWGHVGLMDFLQPIFLFVCGAAVPFAIPKRLTPDGRPTAAFWKHVLGRVGMLWGLGLLMHGNFLSFDPSKFLVYNNTLQTIAVGYLAAALAMLIRRNGLLWRSVLALVLVSVVPLAITAWGDYTNTGNLSRIVDERIYAFLAAHTPLTGLKGKDFCYFLTTLTWAGLGIAGSTAAEILRSPRAPWRKAEILGVAGGAFLVAGLVLTAWIPPLRHIYTLSFNYILLGVSFLVLGVLFVVTDIWKCRSHLGFFLLIGQFSLLTWCLHTFFRPAINKLVTLVTFGIPNLLGTSWPQPAVEQLFVMVAFTCILLVRYHLRPRG